MLYPSRAAWQKIICLFLFFRPKSRLPPFTAGIYSGYIKLCDKILYISKNTIPLKEPSKKIWARISTFFWKTWVNLKKFGRIWAEYNSEFHPITLDISTSFYSQLVGVSGLRKISYVIGWNAELWIFKNVKIIWGLLYSESGDIPNRCCQFC